MKIKVQSSSFKDGEEIPPRYTFDGENISPNLKWHIPQSGIKEIKTFLIIAESFSSAKENLVHWIIYNIPSHMQELHENVTPSRNVTEEIHFGTNDFGLIGYSGPKPSKKSLKYYFNIYGLDCAVHLDAGAMKKQILEEIKGHIIARGRLTGKYKANNTL